MSGFQLHKSSHRDSLTVDSLKDCNVMNCMYIATWMYKLISWKQFP